MPLAAVTFEKLLVSLMYQDVQETLSLNSYEIYQNLEMDELSRGHLKLTPDIVEHLSEMLVDLYKHPQLKNIEVIEIIQNDKEISLKISILLTPTLYRSIYDMKQSHEFIYKVELPMDRKDNL